ncbi:CHAT domain-containing protein [Nocardioides marmoriginsengisoli]|uniref:CHAT domain-containing protein n=1 Tax=Nocardioides marmoriginsengisoli TaxID=661483 RepID=A0A3N0CHS1_9ACTN|nr:CHAT domain-containing protein [Nocardioides marmoriginsengisoli]RNL63027.1 CHAT domain-containing protein [Nocardioides marmoriginsengisoli]
MRDAEDLHQRAVEAANTSEYARSLELIAQARARTADADLIDRLDITAAWGEGELGNHAGAVSLCQGVLAREGVSRLALGLAHAQLGMVLMRNGDTAEASDQFAAALEPLQDLPEHLAGVHTNRGYMYLKLNDPLRAADDFTRATDLYGAAGETLLRAKAQFNLAYAQLLRSDLVAAIRGMDEAAAVLIQEAPINQAIVEQDRAEVLLASGRAQEAAAALEAAVTAYGNAGLRRFQADCEIILARTVLADDPARSRALAARASRRYDAHGSPVPATQARAAVVIAEIEGGATTKSLLTRADALAADLRKAGLRHDADRLALHTARLAIRRRELPDAAARLAKVRTNADSPISIRLLTRELRAEHAAARNHPGRSRSYARQGLGELHSWQATFGSLDLQTSTVGHGQHLARLGLRAAMADGSPAVLFEWSERARALASRVTSLRPPPDPGLAADLTALRLADPADVPARRVLRDRIRAHSWFATQGTVGEPTDLATLQARLAVDDSALIAHLVLDGSLTALAVTATDATVIPLGEAAPVRTLLDRIAADLDFAAQNRAGPMGDAVRTSLRADLAKVADLLIRPTLSTVGYRRLVLTPSALLTGTPWTELPGLIGRPVTVPTSATAWLESAREPIGAMREVGFLAGPRLARAEEEVRRAHDSWPRGHVLAGAEADSVRAGWLAARVDLLHLAGHGTHPGDHPLFAAVELADGPWFGHDIDLLPRVPDVVVLSACDLGQSSVLHSEESLGMSAVWLHAGARAVLSSLALVADDLACEVFASWHHQVAGGAAPADALARVSAETDDVVPFLCFGAGW